MIKKKMWFEVASPRQLSFSMPSEPGVVRHLKVWGPKYCYFTKLYLWWDEITEKTLQSCFTGVYGDRDEPSFARSSTARAIQDPLYIQPGQVQFAKPNQKLLWPERQLRPAATGPYCCLELTETTTSSVPAPTPSPDVIRFGQSPASPELGEEKGQGHGRSLRSPPRASPRRRAAG